MRASISGLRNALLASLGVGVLAACGGATDGDTLGGTSGSPSRPEGGASNVAGSGGRGPTTGGATTGGATTGGATTLGLESCRNPRPLAFAAMTAADIAAHAGFVECDGGWLHRPEPTICGYFPRDAAVPNGSTQPAACERDADCTERAFGHCEEPSPGGPPGPPFCVYGCATDSDCETGRICLCAEPAGVCVLASCTRDSDCGNALCAGTPSKGPCGDVNTPFACQRPDDACRTGDECGAGATCEPSVTGGLECRQGGVCGRPFLVHGAARTAEPVREYGWTEIALPDVGALDLATRRALAEHWTSLGLMEHASVAAFARFALELLALGAPSELLEATQRALGDEIAHARLCFGMAGAYAGSAVGPSALPLDGALDRRSRSEIVVTAFLEACVGETLAAVEAATLAEHAVDPVVRAALERIAADEARHAELGFRFVRWALETAPAAERAALERELWAALERERAVRADFTANEVDRLAHGVPTAAFRAEARAVAFGDVISPCVRALLGPTRAAA